jgi:hypothetical protein
MSRALSQVVRKFIVGELRGETAGEIVIPSCDPAAQVGNPRFIKPVSGKVLVGEAWQRLILSATSRPSPRSCAAIPNRCERCSTPSLARPSSERGR